MLRIHRICLCLPLLLFTLVSAGFAGKVRQYYVAADELEWDYAPSGIDQMMGMPFHGVAKDFMEQGPHRIGHVYKKAVYHEYTDATFKTLKPRPPEWQHLGILGPLLRAEVGDTIKILFKNNGTHPYSMHPHGVFYEKPSEGTAYDDGTNADSRHGGAVPPGQTHTYIWEVPERAGPGPNDPSSIVWLYHSHANEMVDVHSGLMGVIIVTRAGMALPDGRPRDVDKEFVGSFMIYDENVSWFLDDNIKNHTGDPAGVKKDEATNIDAEKRFQHRPSIWLHRPKSSVHHQWYAVRQPAHHGDEESDHVRWYLVTLGFGFNFHTPHWHGNVVLDGGRRTDVLALSPAQMLTVDMIPDDPGIWLFHCHVSDHMEGGMVAKYQVLP